MKLIKFLDEKFEEYILMCTLIITVTLIFVQVLMRYVFKNSLSWSEELARYIYIWQAWISPSYAVKKAKHIKVDFLNQILNPRALKYVETIVLIIWLVFCVFFAYEANILTNRIVKLGQLSPALQIPMGYVYRAVPVGCILMSIRLVQQLYFIFKKKSDVGTQQLEQEV